MTAGQLRSIMPRLSRADSQRYIEPLVAAMVANEIKTLNEKAAFLAQIAHESCELRFWEELASGAAYEGRKDLGNTQPGDGRRFKGRGPIQLTGRANYAHYSAVLGVDLVGKPELAAKPDWGFQIAGLFWREHHLNDLADSGDFAGITRAINGGLNGEADRERYYRRALRVLAV